MPMDRVAQEEIFGPVLSVIRVNGYEEVAMAVNSMRYGLSSSIFTRDTNTAFRAMRDFDDGHRLRQCGHDRRRDASAVRWHEADRQRPPRGRPRRARHVHRVEVDLRRLLRPAPARTDRQSMTSYLPPANTAQDGDRYSLTTAQRHALWENEIAMFIVLLMPLVVASFWYGATIQVIDFQGNVAVPTIIQSGSWARPADHVLRDVLRDGAISSFSRPPTAFVTRSPFAATAESPLPRSSVCWLGSIPSSR